MKRRYLQAISPGEVDFFEEEIDLKPNQVLVKNLFSGISSGTERKTLEGKVPSFQKHWDNQLRVYSAEGKTKKFPVKLGYETIGEVVDIGSEVTRVTLGDRVWVDGSHATYSVVHGDEAYRNVLRNNLDPKAAVFWPLTRVALGAVHDAQIKVGDNVVVIGQGVVGLLAAQIAQVNGANVFAVDTLDKKLEYSKKLGCVALKNSDQDLAVHFKKHYVTKGADAVIEASGTYEGLKLAVRMCGLLGKVVTVGSYPTEASVLNLGEEWQKNKITMISSMTINDCPHPNYPLWDLERLNQTAQDLLSLKKIEVLPLVTHIFNFDEAKKAYALLMSGDFSLKIVLAYD